MYKSVQEDTEILVEVHAASVHPGDCKMRAGEMVKEVPLALPAILGQDFSGIVRKVGGKVRGYKPGDPVFGRQTVERLISGRSGTYAEWVVVDANDVCLKPESLSHEQAAACPTVRFLSVPHEHTHTNISITGHGCSPVAHLPILRLGGMTHH
jgi:NADPH:quinone reductase-like Zn-dependent oxidoreductase